MTLGWRSTFALVAAGLLGACTPSRRPSGVVISDSLGITVVDHGEIDFEGLPQLRLDAGPIVSIGVVDGAVEYQFHDVTDAVRRRDGSIAVVDRSRTLRVFDSTGLHRWTAGADGDGPGEFRYPQRISEIADDTLVVWDARPGRFSLFVDPGEFVRGHVVEGLAGVARVVGSSAEDQMLIERRSIERGIVATRSAITVTADLYHMKMTGTSLASIGHELLAIQYQEVSEGGAYSPAIFEASAVLAPSADGYWYGDSKRYELKHVAAQAGVTRIVRWVGPAQTIQDADFDAVLDVWSGGESASPDVRQYIREYGRTHPRADRFASYEELLTDSDGRLWLRDFVRDHQDDGRRRWLLFSADGTETLGRLEHSARFTPLRVDQRWVLGVERDDLDVESVVIRRVIER